MTTWAFSHIEQCNKLAQASPLGVRRAALLALLSAQQAWHTVPAQLIDVIERGFKSPHLWGWKRTAFRWLENEDNLDALYAATVSETDPVSLLDAWTQVPGLGLAKGGFAVQLCTGQVGCIDRHNLKRYGINKNVIRFDKTLSPRAQLVRIQDYVHLCSAIGGSTALWAEWCRLMYGKYPKHYASAAYVSLQHVELMKAYRSTSKVVTVEAAA